MIFTYSICIFIHYWSGNAPMRGQYIILDFHVLTNTYSIYVLYVQPHRFQGLQLDYCHTQTTGLCRIGQIIGVGGRKVRSYLGSLLLVVEHFPKFIGYSWCWIFIDLKNYNWMSIFPVLCCFHSELWEVPFPFKFYKTTACDFLCMSLALFISCDVVVNTIGHIEW